MAASTRTTALPSTVSQEAEATSAQELSAAAIKSALTIPAGAASTAAKKASTDHAPPEAVQPSRRVQSSNLQPERSSPSAGSLPSVPEELPAQDSGGLPLRSPVRSTSSSRRLLHQTSIDRSVESECIIVDEGYVIPPGDEDAAASQSNRDLPPGLSRFAKSALEGLSGASDLEASVKTRQEDVAVRSGSIPPESPFGQLCFQEQADFQEDPWTVEEAEAKLASMHLPAPLMSGLRSLSGSELAVYMQLTEELRSDDLNELTANLQPNLSGEGGSNVSDALSSRQSSIEDNERLESAVRRLKQLLPQSAIDELSSHNSYGLMDILHSQPLTPPSTPASGC